MTFPKTHVDGEIWNAAAVTDLEQRVAAQNGVPSGLATLDGTGKLTRNQLPASSVTVIPPSGDVTGATDRANINAAILSAYNAGGGQVLLGLIGTAQYTINGPILWYPKVELAGVNRSVQVNLANGTNADILTVPNFSSLTHSGTANAASTGIAAGTYNGAIRKLTLDGNRANQTSGEGVRIYGFNYILDDVEIQNMYGNGLYTEWGILSSSSTDMQGLESRFNNLRLHDNGRHAWHHCGPTDCQVTNVVAWSNNQQGNACGVGIWLDTDGLSNGSGQSRFSSGGTQLTNVHVWGLDFTHTWGFVVDAGAQFVNCESEGASVGQVLARVGISWHGGPLFYVQGQTYARGMAMQLGDAGSTAGLQAGQPDLFPASITSYANNCKIDLLATGFMGDQASRAALNWVRAKYCQVSGVGFSYVVPSAQVAVGSNGTDISTWAGAGTLQIGSYANYLHLPPAGGTATVVTSNGTYSFTYTGMTGLYTGTETLTGCTALGGPPGGSTVSTAAVVTIGSALMGSAMLAGAGNIDATSDVRFWAGGYGNSMSLWPPKATQNYLGVFGDGSDGVAVLDGAATVSWATRNGSTYTMTRDCFCASLTVDPGVTLITSGYYVFAGASVTGTGIIQGDGAAGQANGTAGTTANGTTIATVAEPETPVQEAPVAHQPAAIRSVATLVALVALVQAERLEEPVVPQTRVYPRSVASQP